MSADYLLLCFMFTTCVAVIAYHVGYGVGVDDAESDGDEYEDEDEEAA